MDRVNDTISVLHVEDDDCDATLTEYTLREIRNSSFDLARVSTMGDAIRALDDNPVDVVLLDLTLPDSLGLESVKKLKTYSPGQAIIVLTGTDDEAVALQAVKNGAQDYLVKDDLNVSVVSRAIQYSLERQKYDEEVSRLANYDSLTGLPNRLQFRDHLKYSVKNSRRFGHTVSLLFIDCDKFKIINDTLGHKAGDEFLQRFSERLLLILRNGDFIARLGGDEFVVVLDYEDNAMRSPLAVADKIIEYMAEDIVLTSNAAVNASCSIGIASASAYHPVVDEEQLLQDADAAMYSAKQKGGGCVCFYDEKLEEQAERRHALLKGVMDACRKKKFFLHYQPILNASTNQFEGMEALMRWRDNTGQLISPEDFIPLMEETRMIRGIGLWVLKQACEDFTGLRDQGALPDNAWVSVNVSPCQINDDDFISDVGKIIIETSILPSELHLEITENLLLDNAEAIDKLKALRALGVHILIDDFGTGYSSMAYLRDLPVTCLKIDKSFIRQCHEHPRDGAITRAMLALAHNLGLAVIAEGVEDPETSLFLIENNCEYMQGYLYARPKSIRDIRDDLMGGSEAGVS